MGNLLRLLSRDGESCCSLPRHDIFVDFESASPTMSETLLYNDAEMMLAESDIILNDIRAYKGASAEICRALGQPSAESEQRAWDAVVPLVLKLRTFYAFAKKIELLVPKLLDVLCSRGPATTWSVAERLDEHQALVKQFAKLLEFVSKFDELKMLRPAMQNDFSYFRRTSQRLRPSSARKSAPSLASVDAGADGSSRFLADDVPAVDLTNLMSLFFAQATPMLHSLSASVALFVDDNPSVAKAATEVLATMAKICQKMLDVPDLRSRLQHKETELFILRVMVAVVILYDHVHPEGAFARGSPVDVKGCVRILRRDEDNRAVGDGLVDALRYTTKHLNDGNTPKSVRALLSSPLPKRGEQ